MIKRFWNRKTDAELGEKMARLERAERDVATLKERSARADTTLRERVRQNHWGQTLEQMIHGRT